VTGGTADPGPGTVRPATFLPGPVPDRETLEGWTRWRLTRRDFVPAPMITADEHARMTPRQRRLHDLHRVATHSNLAIQETPMSDWVSRKMRSLIETNAFCQGPDTRPGLMVNGGGCQGKTDARCRRRRRLLRWRLTSTPMISCGRMLRRDGRADIRYL
jgi:hypothetical protein